MSSDNKYALDKELHALMSKYQGWLSPASFLLAYYDWLVHLSIAPQRRLEIINRFLKNCVNFSYYVNDICKNNQCELCIPIRADDHRFQDKSWGEFPFNLYSQSFALIESFWNDMTSHISGVAKHHHKIVNFTTRQFLDIFSPSNNPWTNPEVIECSLKNSGMNFIAGGKNWLEDVRNIITRQSPVGTENFRPGKDVAITPGKVIYRNHLIELIQYEPTTKQVYPEPVLFVPAWIMKYYILDLSPNNSMVKYLVDQSFTVFMISWRNPTSEDRDLALDDYLNLGVLSALDAINAIIPNQKVHATGYCIGGTLLMIASAYMAKKNDNRLKTITTFAAQIDFKDAGELLLFIDDSQLSYLEDIMWQKGYLDGSQMAGTFSMLNSVDLIWSRMVHDYMMGTRRPLNDLMAWDSDTTRMSYKMHSQYLRSLFLENKLIQGSFRILGVTISLMDIKTPVFCVSTIKDHVAPWKSVYKIHNFVNTAITFVLTNGGHNSGVISEPGHANRTFKMHTHKSGSKHVNTDTWQEQADSYEGSWWIEWQKWLAMHSGEMVAIPSMGNPEKGFSAIENAPGSYIFQK
jgi:polyhydroxyalkanoate synthase